MANPPLRRDFVDKQAPLPDQLPADEYNLNAQRTDEAWDYAQAGTTIGEAVRTATGAAEARTVIGAVDSAAVTAAVDAVIAGAPGALDTLNELAAALGDDANFAATITTALAAHGTELGDHGTRIASTETGLAQANTDIDALETGKYTKPPGGVPKTDLASAVQTSLGKADNALPSVDFAVAHNAAINLLIDGSYERDTTWWGAELVAGAVDLSTTRAFSGVQSLKFTGSRSHRPNVTAANKTGNDATYGVIKSEAGRVYRASFKMWREPENTTSGFVRLRTFLVGAGGVDAVGSIGPNATVNQVDIPTGQWVDYVGYYVVPSSGTNAPYLGVYPQLSAESVNAADVFYFDHVRFEDITNSSPELLAPPPTGVKATDEANVQPLLDFAQTVKGTVRLRDGTYVMDLITNKVANQPRIIGMGKHRTKIDGTIKWQGVSGQFSGGWFSCLNFTGSHAGMAAVEFNGVCDVHWNEVYIEGTYAVGLLFHNEFSGEFTEINNGVVNIRGTVTTAIEYRVGAGGASFHGSGLLPGSTLAKSLTGSCILIGTNARPYNAPMSAHIWASNDTTPIIQHNGQLTANFHGNLNIEANGTDNAGGDGTGTGMLLAAGNEIPYAGTLTTYLGSGARTMGTFVLINNFQAVGGLLAPDQYVGSIRSGVTPRVVSAASASSLTPNADKADSYHYTALAANLTINAPVGTPDSGQPMRFRIKDNGTSRTLIWNAIFRAVGVNIPTATAVSKVLYVDAKYNATDTKWDVDKVSVEGSVVSGPSTDVQIFTASGTWTKPAGAVSVRVRCIGPGAGGGAGARGPSGTALAGGGGGGSGGMTESTLAAADLTATVSVTVGTGGVGAVGQTTDNTAGENGGAASGGTAFGSYLQAGRGTPGAGGGLAAGGTAGSAGGGMFNGGAGGAGSTTGAAGATAGFVSSAGAGGGGGGITTGSVANAGGGGGTTNSSGLAVGTAGNGAAGGAGTSSTVKMPGPGGGGGGASITGAGYNGGNGGNYGGGGAGGGASLNGNNSGAGGNGGNGLCVVITHL